ncbi:MAG: inositol monophosphatase [Chlorobi bacterium]|nr:inositol monophosphatase [Chlorobiota bacterium]
MNRYLEVAKEAALKAGEFLKNEFGKKQTVTFKSAHDIGLEADVKSEEIILRIITGNFPEHNVYSEETGKINNRSEFTWFVDPLDGTNNFAAGIPYFGISIALLKNEETLCGVVYNPVSGQFFEAESGKGASLNGAAIFPSKIEDRKKAVISFVKGHATYDDKKIFEKSLKLEEFLSQSFRRKLSTWAPALDWALLASGGIDLLVSYLSEPEDFYAGALIAKEAGVAIKNFSGEDFKFGNAKIIAGNNALIEKLQPELSVF